VLLTGAKTREDRSEMRIAITTGGGDCPGLNAVIRAVVRAAVLDHGWEVVGIKDGLEGLMSPGKLLELSPARVRDILPSGGTILGSTNQGNPFRYPVMEKGTLVEKDVSDRFMEAFRRQSIDAVVFVGGDGTQAIAHGFAAHGLRVVGVPKTIDNDLDATDYTFGFDTAVGVGMEAIDRLRTTAASHDRVMIVEVMGRHAGHIALHAGVAGGAEVILIPEIPYEPRRVVDHLRARFDGGITHAIVCVAEGAHPIDDGASYTDSGVVGGNPRLGGAGDRVADSLRTLGDFETRVTVLGHVQRGGAPSHFDRVWGTLFGCHAVRVLAEGRSGRLVVLRGATVDDVPIEDGIGRLKCVALDGSLVAAARTMGVSFGAPAGEAL